MAPHGEIGNGTGIASIWVKEFIYGGAKYQVVKCTIASRIYAVMHTSLVFCY